MQRLIFTTLFLFICVFSFSQQESELLNKAVAGFKKELPKLEKQAFKELRKLDRTGPIYKIKEFKNYSFLIIPTFKLKEDFDKYATGEPLAKYIDFKKMWYHFEVIVSKNSELIGTLLIGDIGNSFTSIFVDSINSLSNRTKNYTNSIKQIINFKPDMVFYPDCSGYLCFIKGDKFYIGNGSNKIQSSEDILPEDEFIKKNISFIRDLQLNKNLELKHYYRLK